MGFACYPGSKSTTCFLAGKEPNDNEKDKILRQVCEATKEKMPLS
jgi:hypothetical protein